MNARRVRRFLLPLPVAAAGLALSAAMASATIYGITGPIKVPDHPFPPGCGGPDEGLGEGVNYHDAEVEPWLDVNPKNPLNMVAFVQQDRWSDGGAHGLALAVTHDGGTTWTTPAPPKFSICAGGTGNNGGFERASDPWVSFANDTETGETVHAISIAFDRSTSRNAVLASRSTDGGETWSDPITLRFDESESGPLANLFNDKESITADPGEDDQHVYAVWDRIVSPADNPRLPPPSYENSLAFRGPVWFARSNDEGKTWEPARPIYAPKASRTQTIGNQIVVLPNGDLLNGFNDFYLSKGEIPNGTGDHVAVIRSTNKGNTWSSRIAVAPMNDRGVRDPEPVDTRTLVRTGAGLPEFAVDRSSNPDTRGNVYAVWQSHQSFTVNGQPVDDSIMLSRSTDGGKTWSDPIKVNHTPPDAYNQQAFTAAVDVADNGQVAVTYFDFRNDVQNDGDLTTDYWIVHSHDGGKTFDDESRITQSGGFDMRDAPYSRGYFVGDYQGLAHAGNVFQTFFNVGVPNSENPSDNQYASAG